jgi:hypothetical protein
MASLQERESIGHAVEVSVNAFGRLLTQLADVPTPEGPTPSEGSK